MAGESWRVARGAWRVAIAICWLEVLAGCGDNIQPEPWTMVVLPDTQVYMDKHPEIWLAQASWISQTAEALNTQLVVHVGDITEWNSTREWDLAREGLNAISKTTPFVLVPGNHDYDALVPRSSRLGEFWPAAEFHASPEFGGLFEADRTDNSFQLMTLGGTSWLILGLEWGPRDAVLAWAADVLDAHPTDHVLIATHAYLYSDNRRYDWATYGQQQRYNPHAYVGVRWPEVNDGEEMWQKLIARRSNIDLVVSGHVPEAGVGRLTSTAAGKQRVHQVLANYQSGPDGGNGYLRIMTFLGDRITVQTYSPYLDVFDTSPEHSFELPWSP